VGVGAGEGGDLRCEHRGEGVLVGRVLDGEHAVHARKLCRLGRDGRGVHRAHTQRDVGVIDGAGAGYALRSTGVELRAIVFGDDENLRAHRSPFCFSAATSSAASFTSTPFCLCAGGEKLTALSCTRGSTPTALKERVSSGFFFAFMMSGSFT